MTAKRRITWVATFDDGSQVMVEQFLEDYPAGDGQVTEITSTNLAWRDNKHDVWGPPLKAERTS